MVVPSGVGVQVPPSAPAFNQKVDASGLFLLRDGAVW
ncbi:hypothetical protein P23_3330 [Acinetobacter calcoaceticus]|nr:hypothetical protein P23_3330 [Acinetobacter calcoaceticus]